MAINLLSKFIIWLKKTLHIRPKSKVSSNITSTGEKSEADIKISEKSQFEVQNDEPYETQISEGKKLANPLDMIPQQENEHRKRLPIETVSPGRKEVENLDVPLSEEQTAQTPQVVLPPSEKKIAEIIITEEPKLEEKVVEVTLLSEQRPPGTPSEKKPQEPSGEEILTPEPQIKYPPEEAKTEEKDALRQRKPYKKKVPTEERKRETIKPPTTERKTASPEQREPIYLGHTQRRRRRLTEAQRKSPSDENIVAEIVDKAPKEKEFATIVESPFVEINLDNAEVYLILPKQQFKANAVDETLHQVSYTLNLNGKQKEVPVGITTNRSGLMFVKEKRILLEEPLVKFQVAFSDEIQGREYNYNHNDKGLYAFVARGSNCGRMCYLYDKEGKIIDIPKRDVWILLNEDFELQTEPDVIEERWIWEEYQPFRINLNEIDALVIKNRISGEEKSFALQSTYRVEGEQLIEDDYKKECPLFTGKTLKIVAPYENQSGWSVWIQNKAAGYKIKENWTGREPLTLRLPDDLPCEFGEFQIDICQQNTRISDGTLFFRLMPRIELNYPKELIIPDPKLGHPPSTISVKLDSDDEWGLEHGENREIKVEKKQHNFYEIELPPEADTFRFTLAKTSQPESIVNFQTTVPRLKWKTSKQMTWNGISQKIERKELKTGEPFYFLIRTNNFDNKYDLFALLEANGQKLQEGKFIRKGLEYSLELNQFFDTVKYNKDELTIRVEIRKMKKIQLVGSVETLYFEGEPKVPKKIPPQKPREKTTSKISNIQALIKCQGRPSKQRKAKGFSKKELIYAGIDLKDVRCLNIPYDRRRKSLHSWNIEILKTLKGRLKIIAGGNNHAT